MYQPHPADHPDPAPDITGTPTKPKARIEIVDALRGSALFAILLLHSVEHFDFSRYPSSAPEWLRTLDGQVRDTAFFLFGGKAYAIFGMMFGLSFFLILDRAAHRGQDFRARFLWRLAILAIIGWVHSLIYCGDILTFLAVMGLPLVILHSFSDRVLGWLSALFLLQLPFVWQLGRAFLEAGHVPPVSHYGKYYGAIFPAFGAGGFFDVIRANLVNGQLAKWWWSIDNGRYLQMLGLFIWGLLLGRKRIFENPQASIRLAMKALLIGALAFPVFYGVQLRLGHWLPRGPVLRLANTLAASYGDLAQTLIWAGGFILLYHLPRLRAVLRLLVPYGRMSLTCYVTQGLFWVPMYYNFGFGLYRHWGQFYSVLAGGVFFVAQLALAHWWLKRFHYGPLEWLWRCGTFLSTTIPFRKGDPAISGGATPPSSRCAQPFPP